MNVRIIRPPWKTLTNVRSGGGAWVNVKEWCAGHAISRLSSKRSGSCIGGLDTRTAIGKLCRGPSGTINKWLNPDNIPSAGATSFSYSA
jgi:hypothetical protein